MSHTPGPWEVRDGDPLTENLIANVRGLRVFGGFNPASCGEDARLIAAAPDMYEVLKGILECWDNHEPAGQWRNAMRDAIAKAEGN